MDDSFSEWLNEIGGDCIALPEDGHQDRRARLNIQTHDVTGPQPYGPTTAHSFSSSMLSGQIYGGLQANTPLLDAPYQYSASNQASYHAIGQASDRWVDSTCTSRPPAENTSCSTAAFSHDSNGNILPNEFSDNFTGWTSPLDFTSLSNATQNSYRVPETHFVNSNNMLSPMPEQKRHSIPLKRDWKAAVSDGSTEGHIAKKPRKLSLSVLIRPTPKQELDLEQQLAKWEETDHFPTEAELKALATLTKLKPYKVALWFGSRLRIASEPLVDAVAAAPLTTDLVVLTDIENDIQKANNSDCANGQSKKAVGGKYRCTWKCGYSTDFRNAWERHEELKQPQKFWHCIACRDMRPKREVFIAHRPDKFLPHASVCHPDEDREQLRARSEVRYKAPFFTRCTYYLIDEERTCNHYFVDWKERNNHWIRHFDEEAQAHDPYALNDSDGGSGGDGGSNNDQERSDAHQKYENFPSSGPIANFGYQSNSHIDPSRGNSDGYGNTFGAMLNTNQQPSICSFTAQSMRDSQSQHPEVCPDAKGQPAESNDGLAAQWLIHVRDYRVVEAKRELRYIALGYSPQQCPSTACLEAASALPPPILPPAHRLPGLFQTALHLAKVTGIEYLWIDVLCGLKKGRGGTSSVYNQAKLILAMGALFHDCAKTWHFFCDFSHLRTMQLVGSHGVSFQHLKQLGHGAYSVVDKVQLNPALGTLARKTVFRTDSKLTVAACWMQEIQIMQKLKHPHITRFIAAYHDQRAFNILMWPVADCDMRLFLAHPDNFPTKRKYLPTWFMSLAEALAFVHKMQCRHKDIKPANVLISGSNVLLTDFGTSTDFSTTVSTSTGGALMTPKYCAPEVAAKGKRGRSADVFSLGCVFAEMITVALGSSLEEMHQKLGMAQNSHDRRATYHNHLPELKCWLEMLMRLASNAQQKRVLRTTISMVARQPSRRPRASSVTRALCSKESCTGLRQGATCHCCPKHPAIAPSDARGQQPPPEPVPPRKVVALSWPTTKAKELLSIAYHSPGWEFTGGLRKSRTGKYDLTISLQSQGCHRNRAVIPRNSNRDVFAAPCILPIAKVPCNSTRVALTGSTRGSTPLAAAAAVSCKGVITRQRSWSESDVALLQPNPPAAHAGSNGGGLERGDP